MKKYKLILLLSLFLIGAGEKPNYTDINNHWAQKYIEKMSDHKLILGYTDGSFRPNHNILNVEAYSIFNRMFKFNNYDLDLTNNFDSIKSEWYYHELLSATSAGYINLNNDFKVEPISRLEVCRIIGQIYNFDIDANMYFSDTNELTSKEISSINSLARDGIINGFGDGTFRPYEPITRAQLSKIFVLLKEKYGTDFNSYDANKKNTLLLKLNELYTNNLTGLSSQDIEKLNFILSKVSSDELISASELDKWIQFINSIKIDNSTLPNDNHNLHLTINVTDSNGNKIPAEILLNNKVFDNTSLSAGKYLLKVTAQGKKPYEAFIEMSADKTIDVVLEDAKQNLLTLTLNSPALSSKSGLEFKSGARVTVNIYIPNGMEVDYLLVNGVKKGVPSDEFTFIITQNTQIDVSFKPE